MQSKTIISDTSCFIVLSNIGELYILQLLYKQVVTTKDIAQEFGEPLPEWVEIRAVTDQTKRQLLEVQVDKCEASAIALALESENPFLILDDFRARKLAGNLKISYTGTLGVILAAKQKGIISSIKLGVMMPKIVGVKQQNNVYLSPVKLKRK